MVAKHCCHGVCNSDSRYAWKSHMEGVFFLPFPKPKTNLEKCKLWVKACGRKNFGTQNITKGTYICSKHFVGGKGPTTEHPNPLPASATELEVTKASKPVRPSPRERQQQLTPQSPSKQRKSLEDDDDGSNDTACMDQLELLELQQQQHHPQQQLPHLQQQGGAQHFMTEIDKKPVILVVPSIPGPSSSSSSSTYSKMAATPMNVSSAATGRSILTGQAVGGNPQLIPAQEMPTNLMVKQGHSSGQPAYAGGRMHAAKSKGNLNAAAVIQQLQQQRPSAPQSKYAELLAVIEDMGRDIRPTYAGSRTATERLRRGITHAKALVRECLAETERSART